MLHLNIKQVANIVFKATFLQRCTAMIHLYLFCL